MRTLKTALAPSLFFSLFFFFSDSQAKERLIEQTAKIYSLGKTNESAPLYIQKTTLQWPSEHELVWSSEIRDGNEKVIMTEKSTIKNLLVQSQDIEHFQTQKAYSLSREGEHVQFKTFSLKERSKALTSESSKIKTSTSFITGPVTVPFIQSRWDELVAGKSLQVEFGVFELERKVGFVLKKHSLDEKILVVKLKPSNFFIAMLVDPLFMEFDTATKRIVRFKGRTPLKKEVGSQLKPFDAEILYSEIEK